MSKTSRTVVSMAKTATKGEVVPIRVIVQHDMESGFRHTDRGVRVPEISFVALFAPMMVSRCFVRSCILL